MAFGDKTKKDEPKTELSELAEDTPVGHGLEPTVHLSVHITGVGCDQLDYIQILKEALEELEYKEAKITSGNYNVYYNHKPIPHKDLKKVEHPNEGGKDSFSVRAGK